jgi:low temperature requirement protein LtrA
LVIIIGVTEGGAVGRHASWLELFFDLVVVAAVAQLAHRLHGDPSVLDVALFVLLYLAVWLTWSSFTLYANVAGDKTRRRSMLAAMLAIAVMAAAAPEATGDRVAVFVVAYVVARFLGARTMRETGTNLTAWPTVQGLLGVIPWLVSIWVAPPGRYLLWAAGVVIDVLLPLLSGAEARVPKFARRMMREQAEREGRPVTDLASVMPEPARLDLPHLAERLGLFVIIVLGESVLQVVSVAAGRPWTGPLVAVTLGGFALLVALWWHLFRYGLIATEGRGLPVRVAMPLHFVGTVSITAIAVGLGGIAAHAVHPPAGDRWLLCGGLAGWFLAGILGGLPDRSTWRWLLLAGLPGLAVTLLLGAVGGVLSGPVLTGLLVAVMAWQWWYSGRHDRRKAAAEATADAGAATTRS